MSEDNLKPLGYDSGEQYFYELNQKRIADLRAKLDSERTTAEHDAKQAAHWMKCPKCGEDMAEVEYLGIKVDRCTSCEGVYFDRGEIDLVLGSQKPHHFWERFAERLRPGHK